MSDRFQTISQFYDGLVDRYGHDPRSADYGGPESQQRKFDVLASIMPLQGARVLDVGCGLADWADHLEQRVPDVHYVGIDLSPRMIAEASKRRPDLDLRVANILDGEVNGPFDLVSANGIFYRLGDDAPALMRDIITRMFELCSRAVGFTTLSAWGSSKDPAEFYADPAEVLEFCRTLTPWLTMRHDYHARDFAVYMYKDRTT